MAFENVPNEDFDQTAQTQAYLNLRWAYISEGTLSDVATHLLFACFVRIVLRSIGTRPSICALQEQVREMHLIT